MTDESNGESTFEFVDKKLDDLSISGDAGKTESISSLSSSASLLTPLGVSTSTGNLLSNIAPPSALPSFVASPVARPSELLVAQERAAQNTNRSNEPVQKQPQANSGVQTKQPQGEASGASVVEQNVDVPSEQDSGIIGGSLFSWMKETVANSNVLSKVAEKAKSSVNSMITTLDPQMREFIYSGGDVNIIVASNKEVKVSPVREAFQGVFGKATVTGVAVDCTAVAEQPVGFAAGIKGAEERVNAARQLPNVSHDATVVAIENFLLEVGEDKWYDLGVIILNDPKNNVNLQSFTQMTPVPSEIVALAAASPREATPQDYSLNWSGFSVTTGHLMGMNLQVSPNEWHHALTGVSRRDIILLAAQSLAGIYKNTISPV